MSQTVTVNDNQDMQPSTTNSTRLPHIAPSVSLTSYPFVQQHHGAMPILEYNRILKKVDFTSPTPFESLCSLLFATFTQWGCFHYGHIYPYYKNNIENLLDKYNLTNQQNAANTNTRSLYQLIKPTIYGTLPSTIHLTRDFTLDQIYSNSVSSTNSLSTSPVSYRLHLWCNDSSLMYYSIITYVYIVLQWCTMQQQNAVCATNSFNNTPQGFLQWFYSTVNNISPSINPIFPNSESNPFENFPSTSSSQFPPQYAHLYPNIPLSHQHLHAVLAPLHTHLNDEVKHTSKKHKTYQLSTNSNSIVLNDSAGGSVLSSATSSIPSLSSTNNNSSCTFNNVFGINNTIYIEPIIRNIHVNHSENSENLDNDENFPKTSNNPSPNTGIGDILHVNKLFTEQQLLSTLNISINAVLDTQQQYYTILLDKLSPKTPNFILHPLFPQYNIPIYTMPYNLTQLSTLILSQHMQQLQKMGNTAQNASISSIPTSSLYPAQSNGMLSSNTSQNFPIFKQVYYNTIHPLFYSLTNHHTAIYHNHNFSIFVKTLLLTPLSILFQKYCSIQFQKYIKTIILLYYKQYLAHLEHQQKPCPPDLPPNAIIQNHQNITNIYVKSKVLIKLSYLFFIAFSDTTKDINNVTYSLKQKLLKNNHIHQITPHIPTTFDINTSYTDQADAEMINLVVSNMIPVLTRSSLYSLYSAIIYQHSNSSPDKKPHFHTIYSMDTYDILQYYYGNMPFLTQCNQYKQFNNTTQSYSSSTSSATVMTTQPLTFAQSLANNSVQQQLVDYLISTYNLTTTQSPIHSTTPPTISKKNTFYTPPQQQTTISTQSSSFPTQNSSTSYFYSHSYLSPLTTKSSSPINLENIAYNHLSYPIQYSFWYLENYLFYYHHGVSFGGQIGSSFDPLASLQLQTTFPYFPSGSFSEEITASSSTNDPTGHVHGDHSKDDDFDHELHPQYATNWSLSCNWRRSYKFNTILHTLPYVKPVVVLLLKSPHFLQRQNSYNHVLTKKKAKNDTEVFVGNDINYSTEYTPSQPSYYNTTPNYTPTGTHGDGNNASVTITTNQLTPHISTKVFDFNFFYTTVYKNRYKFIDELINNGSDPTKLKKTLNLMKENKNMLLLMLSLYYNIFHKFHTNNHLFIAYHIFHLITAPPSSKSITKKKKSKNSSALRSTRKSELLTYLYSLITQQYYHNFEQLHIPAVTLFKDMAQQILTYLTQHYQKELMLWVSPSTGQLRLDVSAPFEKSVDCNHRHALMQYERNLCKKMVLSKLSDEADGLQEQSPQLILDWSQYNKNQILNNPSIKYILFIHYKTLYYAKYTYYTTHPPSIFTNYFAMFTKKPSTTTQANSALLFNDEIISLYFYKKMFFPFLSIVSASTGTPSTIPIINLDIPPPLPTPQQQFTIKPDVRSLFDTYVAALHPASQPQSLSQSLLNGLYLNTYINNGFYDQLLSAFPTANLACTPPFHSHFAMGLVKKSRNSELLIMLYNVLNTIQLYDKNNHNSVSPSYHTYASTPQWSLLSLCHKNSLYFEETAKNMLLFDTTFSSLLPSAFLFNVNADVELTYQHSIPHHSIFNTFVSTLMNFNQDLYSIVKYHSLDVFFRQLCGNGGNGSSEANNSNNHYVNDDDSDDYAFYYNIKHFFEHYNVYHSAHQQFTTNFDGMNQNALTSFDFASIIEKHITSNYELMKQIDERDILVTIKTDNRLNTINNQSLDDTTDLTDSSAYPSPVGTLDNSDFDFGKYDISIKSSPERTTLLDSSGSFSDFLQFIHTAQKISPQENNTLNYNIFLTIENLRSIWQSFVTLLGANTNNHNNLNKCQKHCEAYNFVPFLSIYQHIQSFQYNLIHQLFVKLQYILFTIRMLHETYVLYTNVETRKKDSGEKNINTNHFYQFFHLKSPTALEQCYYLSTTLININQANNNMSLLLYFPQLSKIMAEFCEKYQKEQNHKKIQKTADNGDYINTFNTLIPILDVLDINNYVATHYTDAVNNISNSHGSTNLSKTIKNNDTLNDLDDFYDLDDEDYMEKYQQIQYNLHHQQQQNLALPLSSKFSQNTLFSQCIVPFVDFFVTQNNTEFMNALSLSISRYNTASETGDLDTNAIKVLYSQQFSPLLLLNNHNDHIINPHQSNLIKYYTFKSNNTAIARLVTSSPNNDVKYPHFLQNTIQYPLPLITNSLPYYNHIIKNSRNIATLYFFLNKDAKTLENMKKVYYFGCRQLYQNKEWFRQIENIAIYNQLLQNRHQETDIPHFPCPCCLPILSTLKTSPSDVNLNLSVFDGSNDIYFQYYQQKYNPPNQIDGSTQSLSQQKLPQYDHLNRTERIYDLYIGNIINNTFSKRSKEYKLLLQKEEDAKKITLNPKPAAKPFISSLLVDEQVLSLTSSKIAHSTPIISYNSNPIDIAPPPPTTPELGSLCDDGDDFLSSAAPSPFQSTNASISSHVGGEIDFFSSIHQQMMCIGDNGTIVGDNDIASINLKPDQYKNGDDDINMEIQQLQQQKQFEMELKNAHIILQQNIYYNEQFTTLLNIVEEEYNAFNHLIRPHCIYQLLLNNTNSFGSFSPSNTPKDLKESHVALNSPNSPTTPSTASTVNRSRSRTSQSIALLQQRVATLPSAPLQTTSISSLPVSSSQTSTALSHITTILPSQHLGCSDQVLFNYTLDAELTYINHPYFTQPPMSTSTDIVQQLITQNAAFNAIPNTSQKKQENFIISQCNLMKVTHCTLFHDMTSFLSTNLFEKVCFVDFIIYYAPQLINIQLFYHLLIILCVKDPYNFRYTSLTNMDDLDFQGFSHEHIKMYKDMAMIYSLHPSLKTSPTSSQSQGIEKQVLESVDKMDIISFFISLYGYFSSMASLTYYLTALLQQYKLITLIYCDENERITEYERDNVDWLIELYHQSFSSPSQGHIWHTLWNLSVPLAITPIIDNPHTTNKSHHASKKSVPLDIPETSPVNPAPPSMKYYSPVKQYKFKPVPGSLRNSSSSISNMDKLLDITQYLDTTFQIQPLRFITSNNKLSSSSSLLKIIAPLRLLSLTQSLCMVNPYDQYDSLIDALYNLPQPILLTSILQEYHRNVLTAFNINDTTTCISLHQSEKWFKPWLIWRDKQIKQQLLKNKKAGNAGQLNVSELPPTTIPITIGIPIVMNTFLSVLPVFNMRTIQHIVSLYSDNYFENIMKETNLTLLLNYFTHNTMLLESTAFFHHSPSVASTTSPVSSTDFTLPLSLFSPTASITLNQPRQLPHKPPIFTAKFNLYKTLLFHFFPAAVAKSTTFTPDKTKKATVFTPTHSFTLYTNLELLLTRGTSLLQCIPYTSLDIINTLLIPSTMYYNDTVRHNNLLNSDYIRQIIDPNVRNIVLSGLPVPVDQSTQQSTDIDHILEDHLENDHTAANSLLLYNMDSSTAQIFNNTTNTSSNSRHLHGQANQYQNNQQNKLNILSLFDPNSSTITTISTLNAITSTNDIMSLHTMYNSKDGTYVSSLLSSHLDKANQSTNAHNFTQHPCIYKATMPITTVEMLLSSILPTSATTAAITTTSSDNTQRAAIPDSTSTFQSQDGSSVPTPLIPTSTVNTKKKLQFPPYLKKDYTFIQINDIVFNTNTTTTAKTTSITSSTSSQNQPSDLVSKSSSLNMDDNPNDEGVTVTPVFFDDFDMGDEDYNDTQQFQQQLTTAIAPATTTTKSVSIPSISPLGTSSEQDLNNTTQNQPYQHNVTTTDQIVINTSTQHTIGLLPLRMHVELLSATALVNILDKQQNMHQNIQNDDVLDDDSENNAVIADVQSRSSDPNAGGIIISTVGFE